jgi:hypothetical protein
VKILFVVGGLQQGADGVGDYVRRLMDGLRQQGVGSDAIALNDAFVTAPEFGDLDHSDNSRFLRLPRCITWSQRVEASCRFVQERLPNFLSLQYVPFAFDPRGFSNQLAKVLPIISKGIPWHMMAHELWIDWSFPVPWRHKCLGILQKPGVKRIVNVLKPQVVHTQLEYYQRMLRSISVQSELLPLHGNIPLSSLPDEGRHWLARIANVAEDDFAAGFFGDILPTLDLSSLLGVIGASENTARRVFILSAGRLSSRGRSVWLRAKELIGSRASLVELGALSEREVSHYLSSLDVGLTSYPIELAKKSGGVAAMLEHGKSVRALGRLGRSGHSSGGKNLILPEYEISNLHTAARLMESLTRKAQGSL